MKSYDKYIVLLLHLLFNYLLVLEMNNEFVCITMIVDETTSTLLLFTVAHLSFL